MRGKVTTCGAGLSPCERNPKGLRPFLKGSERRTNAVHLVEMQQIVAGIEPDHVVETFFSSLGMNADATKVGVGGPVEQAEVGAAQHAEAVQRFRGIRVSITQPIRP